MDEPVNWMNAGSDQDRIDRAIRWTKLENFTQRTSRFRFDTIALWRKYLVWAEAGQDWLAGPLMAAKFRERLAADNVFKQKGR